MDLEVTQHPFGIYHVLPWLYELGLGKLVSSQSPYDLPWGGTVTYSLYHPQHFAQ